MRYNEKTELEATGEWLMRINEAGFSEELFYVPSQLSKLGVAPVDVVDRLDWLKENRDGSDMDDHGSVEVVAHEEPEDEQEPEEAEPEPETVADEPEALVSAVEMLEERPLPLLSPPTPVALDYDSYGAWEWAEPNEKLVEDAILALFELAADLPDFSDLALAHRPTKPRARGKRARAAKAATVVPVERELVSVSVGASA